MSVMEWVGLTLNSNELKLSPYGTWLLWSLNYAI